MLTTLAQPSSRGRCKDDWNSSMVHNERADSYSSPRFIFLTSRSRRTREPLLTDRRVAAKTESVSESIDDITGDVLRLQLFLYADEKSENCPAKTAHRRAAEPRAHFGGGEGGVYSVRRERQPRRHC